MTAWTRPDAHVSSPCRARGSGDSGHVEAPAEANRPRQLLVQASGSNPTVQPAGAANSAQAQVQQLLALADGLLPAADSPQAQEKTSLRDALKESWAGKVCLTPRAPPREPRPPESSVLSQQSYYDRLAAIVDQSPAPKRRRATQAQADASPLSRAAMAAAALDDEDEADIQRPAPVQVAPVQAPVTTPTVVTALAAVKAPAIVPAPAVVDVHAQQIAALEAELAFTKQAHQQSVALLSSSRLDVSRLTEELSRSKAHASALQAVIQNAMLTLASASHP